jgi:hypothetical protein
MLTTPKLRTFPCPNCQEIVDDSATACRFCKAEIEPATAGLAIALQEKVNRACSDASFVEVVAIATLAFLLLTSTPLAFLFFWGFVITFVMVPALIIRWLIKFSRLRTPDRDYRKAWGRLKLAFVLWLGAATIELFPILDEWLEMRKQR